MGPTVNLGVAEKYSEYTSFPGFPDFFNTLNVFIVLSSGKRLDTCRILISFNPLIAQELQPWYPFIISPFLTHNSPVTGIGYLMSNHGSATY